MYNMNWSQCHAKIDLSLGTFVCIFFLFIRWYRSNKCLIILFSILVDYISPHHFNLYKYFLRRKAHVFVLNVPLRNIDMLSKTLSFKTDYLSREELVRMCVDVAKGMEHLASHHLIHRDVATRNCLVADDLTIKIADFGMSRDIYSNNYYKVRK